MRIQRLIAPVGLLLALTTILSVALLFYWKRQPVLRDPAKILTALQAYARDQKAHGHALPPSVSLQELIAGGYITGNDVGAFEGMDVTIALSVDETRPQDILMRVRMPDGRVVILHADGSAEQALPSARPRLSD